MTVITIDHLHDIDILRAAGMTLYKIAKQLNIKYSTLKAHIAKQNLLPLPPKVKLYKGHIQGRKQLQIKRYLEYNPFETLAAIKEACELDVGITTIHKYLKNAKLKEPSQNAKFYCLKQIG
jgi:DNA-binding MarR family transcriptional regulator